MGEFLPGRVAASPADLDRFRKEVRIAREVSHPNVCRTYDIAAVEAQVFLVMEYIDGEDLASVLQRLGRPSPDKASLPGPAGVVRRGGEVARDGRTLPQRLPVVYDCRLISASRDESPTSFGGAP